MDKTVYLITGCSPDGIGHRLAVELAKKPGNVVVASLRTPSKIAGDDALRASAATVDIQQLDVVDEKRAAEVVDYIVATYGKIDVLVNNAGLSLMAPAAEMPMEEIRMLFEANYMGSVNLVRLVFPHMAARRSGKIVNVGSAASVVATFCYAHYAATKAALTMYGDYLRTEAKPLNIQVLTVIPGCIKTTILDKILQQVRDGWDKSPLYSSWGQASERTMVTVNQVATPLDQFVAQMAEVIQRKRIAVARLGPVGVVPQSTTAETKKAQ
ncbi:hypothetical protein RI367_005848 [Sorochytrium milnesiophthora]